MLRLPVAMWALSWLLLASPVVWAGQIPEPDQNGMCAVPPIPKMKPPEFIGTGYHIGYGVAWTEFNLNGKKYIVEYDLRLHGTEVESSPFPVRYFLDLNRNGQFDVPGEIWIDVQGNGRCADLELIPSEDSVRPGHQKPLVG